MPDGEKQEHICMNCILKMMVVVLTVDDDDDDDDNASMMIMAMTVIIIISMIYSMNINQTQSYLLLVSFHVLQHINKSEITRTFSSKAILRLGITQNVFPIPFWHSLTTHQQLELFW